MAWASDASLERVRAAAVRVAGSYGLELFDLQFRREPIGWVLRVIIDRAPREASESSTPRQEPERSRETSASARASESLQPPRSAESLSGRSRGWGPGATERSSASRSVEQEEPVTIEDCQRVSQDLGTLLDVDDELGAALDTKYTLEVTSPGLDRPLRGEEDYRRFRGRLAKIVTFEPVDGQTSFSGRLDGVERGGVLLAEGRRTHHVPLRLIKRARLEVEF